MIRGPGQSNISGKCVCSFMHYSIASFTIAAIICLFNPSPLICSDVAPHLTGPFNWSKNLFLDKNYRQAIGGLKVLRHYVDEENCRDHTFLAKINLLLGAAYEESGRLTLARQFYLQAKSLKPLVHIDAIDLEGLPEYRRIILENNNDRHLAMKDIPGIKKSTGSGWPGQ